LTLPPPPVAADRVEYLAARQGHETFEQGNAALEGLVEEHAQCLEAGLLGWVGQAWSDDERAGAAAAAAGLAPPCRTREWEGIAECVAGTGFGGCAELAAAQETVLRELAATPRNDAAGAARAVSAYLAVWRAGLRAKLARLRGSAVRVAQADAALDVALAGARGVEYYGVAEATRVLRAAGIRDFQGYLRYMLSARDPQVPARPYSAYRGFTAAAACGFERDARSSGALFSSHDETRAALKTRRVRALRIDNAGSYTRELAKLKLKVPHLSWPARPARHYGQQGCWLGWDHWLTQAAGTAELAGAAQYAATRARRPAGQNTRDAPPCPKGGRQGGCDACARKQRCLARWGPA
jgi:hypothetical protein